MEQERTAKNKKIRKRILLILFILLNAGVILWTALSEFSGGESAVKFRDVKIKWTYIFPALGCWLAAVCAEITKYTVTMKKNCGYVNVKLAAETVLLGRYYDNVTPSGIGGQPFQIYNLTKGGIQPVHGAVITVTGFLSMQFAFIIIAAFVFAFGGPLIKSDVIRITGYVGLGFYAFFPVVILFFTFMPNVSKKILHFFINLLSKIKIVKNKDETNKKLQNSIEEYSVCVKTTVKSVKTCIFVMLLSIIYQAALCSIPFFIIHAFGGKISFIECFVTTIAIYSAITFIPTPGNSGAAECSFYAMFSMITSGYVFWAMLSWRFLCYYLFIIIGLLIYLKKHFEKKKLLKQEAGANE